MSMGLGDALAPNKRQTIIWINDDTYHIYISTTSSVTDLNNIDMYDYVPQLLLIQGTLHHNGRQEQ